MALVKLHKTIGVRVGAVQVGGGAPVVVQSMTMTDTADAARDGSAMHRARRGRIRNGPCHGQLAGSRPGGPGDQAADARRGRARRRSSAIFITTAICCSRAIPDCAASLDKYRINPGNVGTGKRRDEQFATICSVARDSNKPVRIGVNGGSLNQELVLAKMQENTDRDLGLTSEEIINECMVLSALQSTELALESGLRKDQIIISCKTSRPRDLIAVYRDLAQKTDQPLHLGLTEAGMGTKGLVWSAAAMGVLLNRGDWRHDPRLADASARRRSARGSLRGVRAAAGPRTSIVRAKRDGLPGMRPDNEHDVPGTRRTDPGLHQAAHARMESACTKGSKR